MIGRTISHYKILEKLGEGGMGVVYKAQDTKLDRLVALKFLPTHLTTNDTEKKRFLQEAKAAARLNHPNICTVYEIGEVDGQSFFAMELVEGTTLHNLITLPLSPPLKRGERGGIVLTDIINYAIQIVVALQEAHKKGIVHRDIKSENIMVNNNGQIKIMDFGLAKVKGAGRLTKTSSRAGTVAYMSPEQIQGQEVDARSDIWSFGVVLYEMLTGQLPFKGDYEQAVIYSILNEEPNKITNFQPNIPLELEKIVNNCLAKDQSARYWNISDLVLDLQSYQQKWLPSTTGNKQQEMPHSASRLIARWSWMTGFVVIITIIIIIMIILFSPSEEQRPLKRKMLVVLPFENLGPTEDEYFANGITEEITSRLASLNGLGVISRTSALHYKNTDKTVGQIEKELNVDYILEGTVRWQHRGEGESWVRMTSQLIQVSDDTHLWSETFDRIFQDIFSIQSEIAKQVIQRLNITLSEAEDMAIQIQPTDDIVAYQAYLRGLDYLKYSHAPEDQYRKAQKMFEQAIELDPHFALAYVKLSEAHRNLFFFGYDHTPDRIEKSGKAVKRALELQPELPAAHLELGYYYYHGYLDYDRALKEFSIAAKSLPNDNELVASIAYVWRRQGLFEQAINNLEHALTLSPNNAMLMAELAQSYLCIRKYQDAIRYCDQCIGIAPDNKWAYLIKTLCFWCWQGDIVNARSALEDMPDKGSPYSILFLYLQEIYEKDYRGALDWLSTLSGELIEVQSDFTPKSLLAGWAYNSLNDSLHARSSFDSARILLEKVLREQPDDPRVHSALGLAYASLGRKEEAIREGKKALELYPVTRDALLGTNRIMDLISIYVMTGNYDDAMDQMIYLLSIPSYHSMNYFRLIPRLDPLRKLPRFQRLMERHSGSNI
jgi:serine/threonine protein kinase/tetratricopeptide (TPR) repeat protein